jgi:hypothetical protein
LIPFAGFCRENAEKPQAVPHFGPLGESTKSGAAANDLILERFFRRPQSAASPAYPSVRDDPVNDCVRTLPIFLLLHWNFTRIE